MAKISGIPGFTGKLGILSAYKMRGVEGIVLRKKGGASKEKIKSSPGFARTRENNVEFSGCPRAASKIKNTFIEMKHLADHNISGAFTAIAMTARLTDTVSERGKRNIFLSKTRHLLEGYELNRKTLFNSVVRVPPAYILSRTEGKANIIIPALIPGIHLMMPWQYPVFRFIVTLGVLPDMILGEDGYRPANDLPMSQRVASLTGWFPSGTAYDGQTLSLALDNLAGFKDHCSLVLGIGIEAGTLGSYNAYEPVKHTGCGKIITVV